MRLTRTAEPARAFGFISNARKLGKDLAARWDRLIPSLLRPYHPEKHYMRGPGPKALGMIGRRFRAETQAMTQEPLPERWLALIHSLDQKESSCNALTGPQRLPRHAPRVETLPAGSCPHRPKH
jgi:hypothetical protein